MNKLSVIAASLALALGSTASYASAILSINPDGVGGDPTIQVGVLDWNAGNALSVADEGESLAAGETSVGQAFTSYAHASLGNFNDGDGSPIGGLQLNGSVLATNYEWTYVAAYREIFTELANSDGTGTSKFVVDPTYSGNFFEIYYDTERDSNNLTGKGFNNGTLILSASFLPSNAGNFTVGSAATADLDGFNTNNYSGYTTVQGGGSVPIKLSVNYANAAFFVDAPSFISFTINATAEEKLAFDQQNPSSCFWNGSAYISGAGNGITGGCGAAGDGGSIGLINGISGPNVIFQTDGTASFEVAIPEPGSLALLGLGMIGLGFVKRRKA